MKTLTEFAAAQLRNAVKTKQDLTAAGKTPEELTAAMGEALKMEGDKLGFLMNAVNMVETKLNDLKRVVVFTLAEGEKAPSGSQTHGEQIYLADYFPPMAGKGQQAGARGDDHPRGGRGGGRDGKGKGKGRGKPRGGDREGRGGGGRPPRRDAAPAGGADRPAPPIPKPRNPVAPKESDPASKPSET